MLTDTFICLCRNSGLSLKYYTDLRETPAVVDLCQDLFVGQFRRYVDLSPLNAGARNCLNHVSF